MREVLCSRSGQRIYGQLYLPGDGTGCYPVVIIGHGLGGSYTNNMETAQMLAEQGIAAYVFDFVGGSTSTRSDGTFTNMSVMTEVADMEAVLSTFEKLDCIDADRIFLMGASQGGCVAALTAADHAREVRGLILFYPAFNIPDIVHAAYDSIDTIPDTVTFFGLTLGKRYATDIWDLDVYAQIARYGGDVLIVHGSRDYVVPIAYSERAVDAYDSAQLVTIEGGVHGFSAIDYDQASDAVLEYLRTHM